jgi:hypothetical protein
MTHRTARATCVVAGCTEPADEGLLCCPQHTEALTPPPGEPAWRRIARATQGGEAA